MRDSRIEYIPLRVSFILSLKENAALQECIRAKKMTLRQIVEQSVRNYLIQENYLKVESNETPAN